MARPILEQTYSPQGVRLKEIKRVYNAFHLIEEKDAKGHITTYAYDGAGRLLGLLKEKAGRITPMTI